jgi:adenylyltransferase/sulfurtransferase
MSLTKEELARYSRQIVMKKVGLDGQKRLKEARVCVAGVGGLGCVSALQLAAMGVGFIRLVDHDTVDITNLHRQFLYDVDSLDHPKVEVARDRLKSLNPNVEVEPIPLSINSHTAKEVVEGVDVVVDGLDRLAPRYALNEACQSLKVPYIYGAAIQLHGYASTIIPGKTACLECMLGRISDEGLPTCETAGVLPPILGAIASVQTKEAVSLIIGDEPSLANKLLLCDLDFMSFEVFSVARNPNCRTCGLPVKPLAIAEGVKVVQLCGKGAFMISQRTPLSLDMAKVASKLESMFRVKVKGPIGITFDYSDEVSVSLMKTGNMLVKGVEGEERALQIYDEVLQALAGELKPT